jgi:hypothetical protein
VVVGQGFYLKAVQGRARGDRPPRSAVRAHPHLHVVEHLGLDVGLGAGAEPDQFSTQHLPFISRTY